MQVYQLEKRSQLISQSLQEQQDTRRELLGKQEKTQRSINRLLDFIKMMQLKPDSKSSPQHPSVSTSCHPQLSSYQSATVTTAAVATMPLQQATTQASLSLPSTSNSHSLASPQHHSLWDQQQQQSPHPRDSSDNNSISSNSSSRRNSPRFSLANSHSQVSQQSALNQDYYSKPKRSSPTAIRSSSLKKFQNSDKEELSQTESRTEQNKRSQCSVTANQIDSEDYRKPKSPAITSPLKLSATTMTTSTMTTKETRLPAKIRLTASTSRKAHLEHQKSSSLVHHQDPMIQNNKNLKCSTYPQEAQEVTSLIYQSQSSKTRLQPNQPDHQKEQHQLTNPRFQTNQTNLHHMTTELNNPLTITTITSYDQSSLVDTATKLTSSISSTPQPNPILSPIPNPNLQVQSDNQLNCSPSSTTNNNSVDT